MKPFYKIVLLCTLLLWQSNGTATILSGSTYRLCNENLTKALTNGGSTANDVYITAVTPKESDKGQAWILTQGSDGYWQIKSSLGEVCMDNPSQSHSSHNNRLLQWQTTGGDNQKWTFEPVAGKEDCYYMIPYESSDKSKSYGIDGSNYLVYETKGGAGTLIKLQEVTVPETPDPDYYRISTADGSRSLSTRESTANGTLLSMEPTDNNDTGQFWTLEATGNYYFISSLAGGLHIDNPVTSGDANYHKLIVWEAGTGNNQKWSIDLISPADSTFYLIPQESSNKTKAYGYDENYYLTLHTKGEAGTMLRLMKVNPPEPARLTLSGEYAIQFISAYPSYNYDAQGKYLSWDLQEGALKLVPNYNYEDCRFKLDFTDGSTARMWLPGDSCYLYRSGSSLKMAPASNDSIAATESARMSFFMSNGMFDLDTRVAWEAGSRAALLNSRELPMVMPDAGAHTLAVYAGTNVSNGYVMRLIALTQGSMVKSLKELLANATALLARLDKSSSDYETLAAIVLWAQEEVNYLYLTPADVTSDEAVLQHHIANYQAIKARFDAGEATGIEQGSGEVLIKVEGGMITVMGATGYRVCNLQGMECDATRPLPAGCYIVQYHGKNVKVAVGKKR